VMSRCGSVRGGANEAGSGGGEADGGGCPWL
jgi:hypothetical protein